MSRTPRGSGRDAPERGLFEAIFALVEHVAKAELTNDGRKLLVMYFRSAAGDSVAQRARFAVRRYLPWDAPTMDEIRERHQAGALDDLDWAVLKVENEARKLEAAEGRR